MAGPLAAVLLLIVSLPPSSEQALSTSSTTINPQPGPYVSISSVGSILAAASSDTVSLFTPEADGAFRLVRAGDLSLDGPHGRIESLVSAGDLLLVCHRAALTILEVTASNQLRVSGDIRLRGPVRGVARIGSYLYAACLPSQLTVIDISSPSHARILVTVPTRSSPMGVMAAGETVLVEVAGGGVDLIDVSKPHAPVVAGFIEDIEPVAMVPTGLIYAWSPEARETVVISPRSANWRRVTQLGLSSVGPPSAVTAFGTTVYWCDETGVVAVIESAGEPSLVGRIELGLPLAQLVPLDGMLVGLSRDDHSIVVIDPSGYVPTSRESRPVKSQRRPPAYNPRLRPAPVYGSALDSIFSLRRRRVGSSAAQQARRPSLAPPRRERAAPPERITTPPRAGAGRIGNRTRSRPVLRFSDRFSQLMPGENDGRPASRTSRLEPPARRMILDQRGWVIPQY